MSDILWLHVHLPLVTYSVHIPHLVTYSVHEEYSDFVDYFFFWRASLHIFYGLQVLVPLFTHSVQLPPIYTYNPPFFLPILYKYYFMT